ncbi:MAG: dihydropteroate synthase [Sphingomonadales bacterium]
MTTVANQIGARVYLRPVGFVAGHLAARAIRDGRACALAGGPVAFTHVERITRDHRELVPVTDLDNETLLPLVRTRAALALPDGHALDLSAPIMFGIVNVTPDSFSDGGLHASPEQSLIHGRALVSAGAHVVDVGGESTRPGADPVDGDEERRRVLPVIGALAGEGAVVSVDTRRAATMKAAIRAGAAIINDVTALTFDPESAAVAAQSRAPVVLMHARGEPRTMQQDPRYEDVVLDVYDALAQRVDQAVAAGIDRCQIIVDPGIGFGKTLAHNLALLGAIGIFHGLGCAVMLGASRKSLIGRIANEDVAARRMPGSLALAVMARMQGVQIFRVHDVAETVQALAVAEALLTDGSGPTPH